MIVFTTNLMLFEWQLPEWLPLISLRYTFWSVNWTVCASTSYCIFSFHLYGSQPTPIIPLHLGQPLFELEASSYWQESVQRKLVLYSGDVDEKSGLQLHGEDHKTLRSLGVCLCFGVLLWIQPVSQQDCQVSPGVPLQDFDSSESCFSYGALDVSLCGYAYQWKISCKLQCAATMRHSVNGSQIIYLAASQSCCDSNHNSVSHWCQPTDIMKDVTSTVVCSKKGSILYLHNKLPSKRWPIERSESTDLHTGNCHNKWIYMGMGNMNINFEKLKISIFIEGGIEFFVITP
jgi:hypothetical protein